MHLPNYVHSPFSRSVTQVLDTGPPMLQKGDVVEINGTESCITIPRDFDDYRLTQFRRIPNRRNSAYRRVILRKTRGRINPLYGVSSLIVQSLISKNVIESTYLPLVPQRSQERSHRVLWKRAFKIPITQTGLE